MSSINDLATVAIATSAAAVSGTIQPASGVVRGALICLEGLDRSGKTTQVKLLEQRFVELGRKVKALRFPGECWVSCFGLDPAQREAFSLGL
jgi:dTMP kinase